MNLVMRVSDSVTVLDFGRKIAGGHAGRGAARPGRDRGLPGDDRLMAPLLELEDVHARYGPVQALRGVSLSVGEGEVVVVLGGNGAGKTTTLRAVSGSSTSGEVGFAGERITRPRPSGSHARASPTFPRAGASSASSRSTRTCVSAPISAGAASTRATTSECRGHFPWLEKRREQQAGTLSGGEQQMLAIARALMSRPRLLLLDEPSLGLAPLVVREIFRILGDLNEQEGPRRARGRAERQARAPLVEPCVRARGRPGRAAKARAPSWPRTSPSASPTSATDVTEFCNRSSRDLPPDHLRPARPGDRDHLPLDGRRELRAGRDGHVHDLHRLDARRPRHRLLGRFALTLLIAFVGGIALERIVVRPVEGKP